MLVHPAKADRQGQMLVSGHWHAAFKLQTTLCLDNTELLFLLSFALKLTDIGTPTANIYINTQITCLTINSQPGKQDLIRSEIHVYLSNSYVSPSSGLNGLPRRSQFDALTETANAVTNCNRMSKLSFNFILQ